MSDPIICYRRRTDAMLADHRQAQKSVERERAELVRIEAKRSAVAEATDASQRVAQAIQQRVHHSIAQVVTRCLSAVFDEPYEFEIRFDRKRNKTEAVLLFKRDGMTMEDPLNEVGGGVVDVAALALRLACVMLSRPRARRFLCLDEPLRNVRGRQNRQRVRGLLLELAEKMGFQFLLNVDADAYPEFALGKIVELE